MELLVPRTFTGISPMMLSLRATIDKTCWTSSKSKDEHVKEVLHSIILVDLISLLGNGVGLSTVEAQNEPPESAQSP